MPAPQSVNLYARIAYLARYQAAKIAVETKAERLTYGALDEAARRVAAMLRASGVAAGDLVGVRLRDTPTHVAAWLGVMRLGAIILPMDWRGTRPEFDGVVDEFRPKAILNDDSPLLDWSPAIVDVAGRETFDPDTGPMADAADGVMGLTMTSGTTGQPKAMEATHVQAYARCATRSLEGMFARDDRFLTTLPLAYLAGREHALNPLLLGATLVMFPTLFEPQELVDFVNTREITAFNLSPNMSRAVLGLKHGGGGVLMPNVRTMVSTTGKLDPHERTALREHVTPRLIDYYGSSGAGPIAVMSKEDDTGEPSAAGRCAIGIEVEIVDEERRPAAIGEVGRIRVRGLAVVTRMTGGRRDEDEGFHDGWYYPGDMGRFGPRGILHLEGRSADLIKRGGLMIHAQEVEQVLRRHPEIKDAAVVGAASADLGQEVVAFIEARSPLNAADLARFCRAELAGYKVPSRFEIVEALPRNAAGKVAKAALVGGTGGGASGEGRSPEAGG
jgi:acyl-CoA synthetase (AMP-forming)/AMP-acid ligase II